MTLIKGILLGSAAGIVAVASAQAADLPTRKGAPVVQYVQICNVGGIVGWTMPGSDTCLKISGYITAQFVGGNLNDEFNWGSIAQAAGIPTLFPGNTTTLTTVVNSIPGITPGVAAAILGNAQPNQRVLLGPTNVPGGTQNTSFFRHETGWDARVSLGLDFASNTAYGPLIGHAEVQGDLGNGLDPLIGQGTNSYYINQAYLTWAGVTAGKAASFYSFTGGGDNFANFFSPDQKGFNEPILMAYTASFGGGFSATLAAQSPGSNGFSGGGTDWTNSSLFAINTGNFAPATTINYGGQRWPDFVGNLHVKQGWGEAQVSGVLHDVHVSATGFDNTAICGVTGLIACNGEKTQTGWGVDAGVKINLQNWWGGFWGAGDDFLVTGSYTESAVWYSGLPDGMWGEDGQVNGNGQPMYISDAFFNPLTNQWSKPTAWSVAALFEHHFTPQFYVDLEGSVGGIKWSNMGGGCNILGFGCGFLQAVNGPLSPSATSWIIGADLGWNPVTNLNFDLELMYQDTNQTRPSGFLGTVFNPGTTAEFFAPNEWKGNSNGFQGRLRITRYF